MYTNNLIAIQDLANANMQAIYHNRAVYDYVIEPEQAKKDLIAAQITASEAKMLEALDQYRKTLLIEQEQELLKKFDASWPMYAARVANVLPLSYAGQNDQARTLLNADVTEKFQIVDDLLAELVKINVAVAKKAYDESESVYTQSLRIMVTLTVIGFGLAFGLGVLIARVISQPVQKIVYMIQELGLGHLGHRLKMNTRDEIGNMAQTIDLFADDLQQKVTFLN